MVNTKQLDVPFLFPRTKSKLVPDPSKFFSPNLLSAPLPTNSFFQNFVLNNGDMPEYIHPYLIKSSGTSVSVCYPSRCSTQHYIYQVFKPDLTISSSSETHECSHGAHHVISSFSDLGVTLDIPSSNMSFFLVRGSPYVTVSVSQHTLLSITTVHGICLFSSNDLLTKYTLQLGNGQTWLIYASSPIKFSSRPEMITFCKITSDVFPVIVRIAVLLDSSSKNEAILDKFSTCYPVSEDALFTKPFCLEYKWVKKGCGDLLLLAHPLHIQLLSKVESNAAVLEDFKYKSIDGDLVGVVGDSWLLKADHFPLTWHSTRGVREESYDEIISALSKDVAGLSSSEITSTSSYYDGKAIARAARLAVIAEEVGFLDVIPAVREFLYETIQPWLDGSFGGNGFFYEEIWGGIVTKEFGSETYRDHHYNLGYFLYGIAVLAKIHPSWGIKYKPQVYSLMANFMNLGRGPKSMYTRLRCFDLYKLHSWAAGLCACEHGRTEYSTSKAVNAYYSAALMGLTYGDIHLVSIGSTLAALEIHAAQMWWHVNGRDNLYEEDFTKENRLVAYISTNSRHAKMWDYYMEKSARLGLHILPLLPISELLFSDVSFVKELVEWALPASNYGGGDGEGWKGFVYALEGIIDNQSALKKIRSLKGFDSGNSLTNLLWWIHSKDNGQKEFCHEHCWFCQYSR